MQAGRFTIGVNLPWLHYGLDFGANAWQPDGGVARVEARRALESIFANLGRAGVTTVRWFMLCDGRAGIRWAPKSVALGLDDRVFADADAAVGIARDHGLALIIVLFDFHLCGRARMVNGVRIRGRRRAIARDEAQGALRARVLLPILARYGAEPGIAAWEVMNEPEWATFGVGAYDPRLSVSRTCMCEFIGRTAALVHAHAGQPVTVGSASARWLPLVQGLGLDFYQTHWYDHLEREAPLDRPVASLNLDRPVVLGEYPTKGSSRSVEEILASARSAGYAGAFAWSLQAADRLSAGVALARALTGASRDRPTS